EDLAQETFLKAWRALNQYDARAPFEHWISRIAARTALDHLRREKKHKQEIGLPDLGEDVLDWLQTDNNRSELDDHSAAEVLNLGMQELSPSDRMVIMMQEI